MAFHRNALQESAPILKVFNLSPMTSSERAQHVAEIVKSALEQTVEDGRSYLDEACADDAATRAEVDSLLKFQAKADGFIEQGALKIAAEELAQEETLTGEQVIGGYKILSKIGAGGMGDVYLAEDMQLGRRVALKLVRAAMSTDDIVARFRHEEHILASLNDPNIAHLYGGGVTPNGIPFFVMEYVEGLRIDEYCDRHELSTAARLQLFRKVCSAVHYAHQHLVIHRDLKPSNILMTKAGEPKLLDFGIAKLLKTDESAPAVTLVGVMTPDYASPEQVRGESITTASDVYSLGVIFYELLTGRGPYQVKNRNPGEIARAITEQEPLRPSTAALRHDSQFTSHDSRSLKGDLDNIALMALRKDPARRYQSVGQFSADIQRHLDGLPVAARKDTFTYRASKFVTRHPFGVAAATLILLSLVGGMMATTWQAQVARQEKAKAVHERSKAEEVKNALVRMLNYSTPTIDSPQNNGQKTVKEILDETAKRLENGEFSNQPEIRVELEQILSLCYFGQGNYALSGKHNQEYLDLHRKLYGEDDVQTLAASFGRAATLFGQGKLTEAEKHYRKIVPLARNEKLKGNIKADFLADILSNFAFLRRTQGDSKEAEALFRETLALSSQIPKESIYLLGQIRSTLASTLADQGKFEEALQAAREAVAEHRRRGETNTPNFSFTLTVLGGFLAEKGEFAEADMNLREAEAIQRKFLSPSNLWLGDNLRNQSISYYLQGRYAESLTKVTETLKIYRETFGPHYDNYPTALIVQGLVLTKTGQLKEGEAILREAVKIRTDSLPKEHYWVALASSALGECLTMQQRYNEAEPLLVGSYESLKHSQGANNPRTRLALQRLVKLCEKWQKPDLAAKYRAFL
jgi:eukaryotic-like serine/threonine-protein kinase